MKNANHCLGKEEWPHEEFKPGLDEVLTGGNRRTKRAPWHLVPWVRRFDMRQPQRLKCKSRLVLVPCSVELLVMSR